MSEQDGTGLEQGGSDDASPSGRTIATAEYHHYGGALPFALHPPILRVSGQSLRTSVHGRYARTQEKGQVLIYNSSLLLCNMIYSSQHNNCE